MKTRFPLITLGLTLLMSSTNSIAADAPISHEQRVREYVTAFNEHKIDAMLTMVSDDIQWLSVDGDKITLETQGKEKLRESMAGYFKSSKAKSELEWIPVTSTRVAALERASSQGKSGRKSQASLSVYEFRYGLISRVYYYPAEK